ncbi:pathogenicity island protein [Staphylococcus equorum]|uniref:pathogenicity island protein n=1 Tax=Staphylococcus TaxID=1279 RepID=UPI000853BE4D|nr:MULTISPECIES: pathogenicity island protein [Staphylococcus]OEK55468.1 pathogenicity island protein [Staphylococcus equorum]RIO38155.1 pathogenicity island protein [Staphylococcus saprophyticus]
MVSDFESNDKITEIELLMHYNPKVINRKIKAMQSQINSLYHLNMSHVITNENDMLVSVSYPLDKLVIHIIDEKEKLDYYTKKAHKRLHLLKNIIKNYTKHEQNEVMKYMLSSGRVRNQSVIERLKEDIYQFENTERQERHNARIDLHQKAFDRHLEQVKNDLSMNRKVLAIP